MGLRGEAAIVGYVELPPERMNKAAPGAVHARAVGRAVRRRAGGCGRSRGVGERDHHLAPGGVGDLRTVNRG